MDKIKKLLEFDVRDFRRTISSDERMNDEAIIYIGSDSERVTTKKGRYIDYSIALVIHFHRDGIGRGCKMLGEIIREPDIEEHPRDTIFHRMYREADLLRLFYARVSDDFVLAGIDPEIHIDVNEDGEAGASNVALSAVKSLIMGTCLDSNDQGIEPHFKPLAPAASFGAHSMKKVLLDALGDRQVPDNVVDIDSKKVS